MNFESPEYFSLFWLLPLLVAFFFWRSKEYKRRLDSFAEDKLRKELIPAYSSMKNMLKVILVFLALALMILSLTRPQLGFQWQEVKKQGIDILVAVDVSKSMLAQDVKPNRLERTKLAVRDLLSNLTGDRVGLIPFAGDAYLMCPLTTDYNGFVLNLKDLDPSIVPIGGTNVGVAIQEALSVYEDEAGDHKALIIVTDGDNLTGEPLTFARKAKEKGIKIHTIGIGSPDGEMIQIRNRYNNLEFLKDAQGNFVKSRLNEGLLKQISNETGGLYVRSSGAQFGFDLIYQQELSRLEKRDFESKREKKFFDRYQSVLFLALCLLIWELCLTRRKYV